MPRPFERSCREFVNSPENSLAMVRVIMVRVILPQHLRTLAHVGSELTLQVEGPVTLRSVLDALEASYPMLRGTIRDHVTQQRRPFLRFFACEEDLSHQPPDAPLPDAVASGKEPLLIIGAIAGG
jgi:sulfur-carrier protein